eukprot:g9673.t1
MLRVDRDLDTTEAKSSDSKLYLESLSSKDVGVLLSSLDLQPGLDGKSSPEYSAMIEERGINGKSFQAITRSSERLHELGVHNPFHIDKIQVAVEDINIDMDNVKIIREEEILSREIENLFIKDGDNDSVTSRICIRLKQMLNNENNGNCDFSGLNIGLVPKAFGLFLSVYLLPSTFVYNLSLAKNKLSSAHIKKICEVTVKKSRKLSQKHRLKMLNLSSNSIRHHGIMYLAKLLNSGALDELTGLNLSKNKIGNIGCSYIASALKYNTQLQLLDVSNQENTFQSNQGVNEISLEGIIALSSALKVNKSLKYLDLSCNRIQLEGCKWLCKSLCSNIALKTLKMFYCHCSLDGVALFASVLRENNSLEYIDLRGNGVSKRDELFSELTRVYTENKYVDLPLKQRYALYHVLLTFCKEGVQDIFQYITAFLRVERELFLTV